MAWIRQWGPAILVMTVIYAASSTPHSGLPDLGTWDFFAKKAGHMFGYALLACSYYHALTRGGIFSRGRLALALCLAFLYAITDEFHQRFIPGRSPSVYDVLVDTVGASLGLGLWRWRKKAAVGNWSGDEPDSKNG
jgi:VanZ family protein